MTVASFAASDLVTFDVNPAPAAEPEPRSMLSSKITTVDRRDLDRRRALRRMRWVATGLLVLMTVVFVATRLAPPAWSWAGYVAAFAEAAMVGACADWFAVTALFRRPLGLPIPHTAIIPRNKAKIGQALGDFIAGEFLSPRVLDRKLKDVQPAARLAGWLRDPAHVDALAVRLAGALPDVFPSADALRGLIGEAIRRAARAGPLAPATGRILSYLWNDAGARRLLDQIIARAGAFLSANGEVIEAGVAGAAWSWLPKWVDKLLADRLTRGLLSAVDDLRDPSHPWRLELDAWVRDLIVRLDTDPDMEAQLQSWKDAALTDAAWQAGLRGVWAELEGRLTADRQGLIDALSPAIARALTGAGTWLAEDVRARDRLDGWIRVAMRKGVSPRRQEIGAFVAQVVAGWDAGEVVEKLELQVGRDLQFIRVNGTLVGGIVGLLIYTITRLLA